MLYETQMDIYQNFFKKDLQIDPKVDLKDIYG